MKQLRLALSLCLFGLVLGVSPGISQAPVVDLFDDGLVDPAWTLVGVGNANQISVDETGGVLELTADGSTAFSAADNAGFLYREVTGDFRMEVTLDGTDMTTGGALRKAGLMVRTDLDPWAPRVLHVLVPYWNGGNQTHLQSVIRENHGGDGRIPLNRDTIGVPRVLRLALQRVGDTLSVEHSTDGGATWIQPTSGLGGETTVSDLPETLLVGLTVVSNDISVTSTAAFDDFILSGDVFVPLGPLVITSAEPDVDAGTLLISGENLGAASFTGEVGLHLPIVGRVVLPVLDFEPSTQQLLVELPALGSFSGTVLLDIEDGAEADRADTFDVTIGALDTARVAALETVVADLMVRLAALETEAAAVSTCRAKNGIYLPGRADADADGCVSPSAASSGGNSRLPTTPLLVVDTVETRTTQKMTSEVRLADVPGSPTHLYAFTRIAVLGSDAGGNAFVRFFDASDELILDYRLATLGGVSKHESTSISISHAIPIPLDTTRFEITVNLNGIRLPGSGHSLSQVELTVLGDP